VKQQSLIWLACLMLLAGFHSQAHSAGLDPYSHFFHDSWGDLGEDLQIAKSEGKQGLLVFFEMDECPFCHRMKSTVLNQPQVQAYYRKHFRCLAIDVEGDVELVDFAGNATTQKEFATKGHRVRATPVFAFFDLEGKPVARYTGATSGPEEFIWLGEYVSQGLYKEMGFTKYKRQRADQAAQPQ
jgi:thioredoxin-related protein